MSARLRLTLSYAGFLALAGVSFLLLAYSVLRFVPYGNLTGRGGFIPNRADLLQVFWPRALGGFLVLLVVGTAGGWVLAGWMLRPLHDIHRVARRVTTGSLDHRVHLSGRRDEFGDLAATFNTMLDRLQTTIDEQRRFAANASHELRTPYAVERAMLDVALADPSAVDVTELLARLDRTNRRGTETVQALLALAALDRAQLPDPAPVDLAELTADALSQLAPVAADLGITVHTDLGEGDLDGVEALVSHLVANLVLNGLRHNTGPGGTVHVATGTTPDGRAQLEVSNTGPVVPPQLLATLTEPFVRGTGRSGGPPGSGLGLSIVSRVAALHAAQLHLDAPPDGGLRTTVVFPPPGT